MDPMPTTPSLVADADQGHTQAAGLMSPVPMSFPSLLRGSKLADRYAYLREASPQYPSTAANSPARKKTRDDRDGKRWVRRKENSRFVGNPHIVQAMGRDMQVDPPSARRTFPEPLPRYLPRSVAAPTPPRPVFDAGSANAGRYSMSMKGMRRTLRGHGPRAQMLVRDVEREVLDWLVGGMILLPDAEEVVLMECGRPIGSVESIVELSRTPLQLIWGIEDDAFARYVVHCCARYHKVVSYSKDVDGRRLTYLLRPNVTRPDYTARNVIDTPPATESDYSLGVLSETDILSVEDNEPISDTISDSELPLDSRHRRLSSVSEQADESGAEVTPRPLRTNRASFLAENAADADIDDDESVVGDVLARSVESLDLNPSYKEPPIRYTTQPAERTPLWDRRGVSRTSSSPSRSPCPPSRRTTRRNRITARRAIHDSKQSFYDYLYC
ncbi:hypothetical protein M0805_000510 [Coniferiporia weirii]|nr:hypothetical protein M0805_000510 [Coniferiporia weirii]